MRADTGYPQMDAADDYQRARRRAARTRLMGWLRGGGEDGDRPISFDEMVDALGRRSQRILGTTTIPLKDVVGSLDRQGEFDEDFRPTSGHTRARWERVAEGVRRGVSLPPIDVWKVGGLYFVEDGHHRVSVARSMGQPVIEANVTEITTSVSGAGVRTHSDLDLRMYQRVMLERVPFTAAQVAQLRVCEPKSFAVLAETVEAWATRTMLAEAALMDAPTIARRWFDEEFTTVAGLIIDAGLVAPQENAADAYLRLSCERYWISRCHTWNDEIIAALLGCN